MRARRAFRIPFTRGVSDVRTTLLTQLRDPLRPVFAASSSSDLRPRVAAQEAFDIAAASLPKPPNVCFVNVSLDHGDMQEAPAVIWSSLCTGQPAIGKAPVMVGQVVRRQRFGGANFVEVLVGHIPELTSQVFTFDSIPTNLDDAFLTTALVDWKLAQHHLADINRRLAVLSQVSTGPVLGCVLPPASQEEAMDPTLDSVCFLNDGLFRGSACGIALQSPLMRTDVLTARPAAPIASNLKTTGRVDAERSEWVIETIDGKRATDVVRDLYETQLRDWATCKLFAAVSLSDGPVIPMAFGGDPSTGHLRVSIPPALPVDMVKFDCVSFVCDSAEHDKEAIAGQLLGYARDRLANHPTLTERVNVARECTKSVVVNDAAVLHWSSTTHYDVFDGSERGLTMSPDGIPSADVHAPSLVSRCLGDIVPTCGVHCGAQIMPTAEPGTASGMDRVSVVNARSSVHAVLRAKNE